MQRPLLIGWIFLAIALAAAGDLLAQAKPAVGSWDLAVDWSKGDDEKVENHILTITPKLSGTIKDVDKGWTTALRDLKVDKTKLTFSFYYGDTNEFLIGFAGTVEGKTIKGTYSIFGAQGKVTGEPLSPSKAKSIKSRPSLLDAYQARTFVSSEGDKLTYRLFVPPNYDAKKKYPLVLFHHGGGGAGDDNRGQLEGACAGEWIRSEAQTKNPCFIVAPQFPGKKEFAKKERGKDGKRIDGMKLVTRTIHEILDSLEREFSIDKNREYVTGLSFGGDCTWHSIFERPTRFAAAVPICAGYSLDAAAEKKAAELVRLPLWIFHGDVDKIVPVQASRAMVKALTKVKPKPKYTEYIGVGHYCWDRAYRDPKLVAWLFAQSKKTAPKK